MGISKKTLNRKGIKGMLEDKLIKLKGLIERSEKIVFFGGAGVSTESHIPDFRSADGLYVKGNNRTFLPETILSHSFFMSHTSEFYAFYKTNMIYESAKPNPAHLALAELEARGKLKAVITQNIDGLHQMAGSKNVLELHGSIHKNKCMVCGKAHSLDHIIHSEDVPKCIICGGIVKPEVVLYEENLDMTVVDQAVKAIATADLLIVGGTSLVVYPAAGLIDYFRGKSMVLINKDTTPHDHKAGLQIHAPIGEVLSQCL